MKSIGVFFGSRSAEHDISIITGQLVISGLKGAGFDVTPVYISRTGEWLIGDDLGKMAKFTDTDELGDTSKYRRFYLDLEQSHGKLVFKQKGLSNKTIVIDLAFPAFHGTFGEDGTIQGLFDMFDIPYVGCDLVSSAIAMDKALTKKICQINSIPTTKFVDFNKNDWTKNKNEILSKIKKSLKCPLFVKPVHLGSSIGIAKIEKPEDIGELENKIEVALYYDEKVLVEEGVSNVIDLTCCIIGNGDLTASKIQESVFHAELFDFEEKYLKDGGSQLGKSESGIIIPARIDDKTTAKIQEMAKQVYRAVGCSGIARVDILMDRKTGNYYAIEVNPLPGTLYYHLWQKSGIELEDLLKKLVELAEEKYQAKKKTVRTFESSVLTQLKGAKSGGKSAKIIN